MRMNNRSLGNLNRMQNRTKQLSYVFFSTIGIFVLFMLTVVAFSKITNADSLAVQEKELETLETYYAAGDYAAMSAYLEQINKEGGSYEKYCRIAALYETMNDRIPRLMAYSETETEGTLEATDIASDLKWCFKELATIEEMEECEYPYEEQDGALYIRQQYLDALKNYMLLTEAEIEGGISTYESVESDYLELAEIALQRLEESNQ